MYIILFFFIYIIIFLIYTRNLKPIDTEIEHFLNNHNESVSLNTGELYKKNTDLQYYDNKLLLTYLKILQIENQII